MEEGKDNVKIVDQIQEQYQLCKLTNLIETIKNKFDLYITNQNYVRWVLKQHFVGNPKPEDFELVEEELPPLQDRQFRFGK